MRNAHPKFVRRGFIKALCVIPALLAPVSAFPASEDVERFYKGNTVSILVASDPGATFGLYAQVFGAHFSRHIPGHPNVIVRFMPGGGGITMFNHLYNVAPKDGTVIGNTLATLPALQLLQPAETRYDSLKFNWLGSISKDIYVLSVRKEAPASTLDELKKKSIPVGSIGQGNPTYYFSALMNELLGTKLNIISGYPSGTAIYKAMEAGEVDGYASVWLSLSTIKGDWLRDGKLSLIAQSGTGRMPYLAQVPTLLELVDTPEKKAMASFLASSSPISRGFAAPPDIPADRLLALEQAFEATVKDPAFVADMEARKLTVEPSSKAEIISAVRQIVETPRALIDELKKIFGRS